MNFDIHPICYFDMAESEFEHFKRLREMKGSNKFVDLSKVSNDEVNKENQLLSMRDKQSLN
jgi:hypothetical protein